MKYKIRLAKALAFNEMQNHMREFADLTEEEFVCAIVVAADSAKQVWPEAWKYFNEKLSEVIPPRTDA